jgi:hypothetical protein
MTGSPRDRDQLVIDPRKETEVLGGLTDTRRAAVEVTFAGQTHACLERIRTVPPVQGHALAGVPAASRRPPGRAATIMFNALLRLACGLPAAFLRRRPPRARGRGRSRVDDPDELRSLRATPRRLDFRRAAIWSPLAEVADRYLEVLQR